MTFFCSGIDIPKLYNVIHYGPPSSVDEYIQESGRGGRDGEASQSVLIYHPNALKGRNITSDMKQYVRSKLCRRETLLKLFDSNVSSDVVHPHLCCDFCLNNCSCDEDHSQFFSLTEKHFVDQACFSTESDGEETSSD